MVCDPCVSLGLHTRSISLSVYLSVNLFVSLPTGILSLYLFLSETSFIERVCVCVCVCVCVRVCVCVCCILLFLFVFVSIRNRLHSLLV